MGDPNEDMTPQNKTTGDTPTLEDIAARDAERDLASLFGINLKPSAGDIWDILDYLNKKWDDAQYVPYVYTSEATAQIRTSQIAQWWAEADRLLAPYAGYGQPEAKEELPGDPLKTYFDAADRMFNTMLGPYPEATFLGTPRYKEAFETLTPSNFDEYLQAQEKTLQGGYQAMLFQQVQGRLQPYAEELATLPEKDRYARMLQLGQELNLGDLPSYQSYLEQQIPRLQTQFRYLNPLPESPERLSAFQNIYPEEKLGEQITPFSQFVANRREQLQSEYSTLVREQLRAGTKLEALPTLEDFYKQRRPELQRSFEMSGPQYTGQTRSAALAPPRRIL